MHFFPMNSIYVSTNVQVFFGCFIIAQGKIFSFLICADGEETKTVRCRICKKCLAIRCENIDYFFANIRNLARALKFPIFFVDSGGFSSGREQILVYYQNCWEICKFFDFFLNRNNHEVPAPSKINIHM